MKQPIVVTLGSRWRFKKTGRVALALWLRSSSNTDLVEFKFDHDLEDAPPRKAKARSFLEHFDRI